MSFAVFADGSANLPKKLQEGIQILPCEYTVEGRPQVYLGDIDAFDAHTFYEGLRNGKTMKTSLLNTQLFFVDVERDVVDAAYHEIGKTYRRTVLYRNLSEELPYYDGYIVVRNMALEAPTIDVEDMPMASLEKILVDFALDRIFPFSDTEIVDIYANATADYSVNTSRMLRYAGRRGRRDVIEEILDEINY